MNSWLHVLVETLKELESDKLALLCVTVIGVTIVTSRHLGKSAPNDGSARPSNT